MAKIREALDEGRFTEFYNTWHDRLAERSEDFSPVPAQFKSRILYRDPATIVPICVQEGIDLGAPSGKSKKKNKSKKSAPEAQGGDEGHGDQS